METAANYIGEIAATENIATDNTFSRPKKLLVSDDTDDSVIEENLRLPDVQNGQSPEEAEYGEPIQVDKKTKLYQTGERSFKTVFSEIPNTFTTKIGKEKEYDSTLVLKEKWIGSDYYTAESSDIEIKFPVEEKSDLFYCNIIFRGDIYDKKRF